MSAFAKLCNIAFTILVFFAVPIVLPVSAIIGWGLIIFGVLMAIGTLAQIFGYEA